MAHWQVEQKHFAAAETRGETEQIRATTCTDSLSFSINVILELHLFDFSSSKP